MKTNKIIMGVLVCAGLFASCNGNHDAENSMQHEIEALQHDNVELKQQIVKLQTERDSLNTIVERVREYVASMNF